MLLLMINNNNNNNNNALILLRSCLSAPKVIHILRCSPRVSHPSLQLFDSLLRSTLLSSDHITNITSHHITNSDFSDSQWLQASLPVRDGGLGVRRVSSLALPASLASAASTLSLQNEILSGCAGSENTFFQTYLSSWSDSFGDVLEALPAKQSIWDRSGVVVD